MTKQKRVQRLFLILLFLAVILASLQFFGGNRLAAEYPVSPVELSGIVDGTYPGEAQLAAIRVKLEVTVEDQKITVIRILEHENGIGYRAEKKVLDQILEQQTNIVDSVGGATISSKVIMKAVSNALNP